MRTTSHLHFNNLLSSSLASKVVTPPWDIFITQVHKVPATDMEALKSPLMGIFEKRRARKFFIYVQDYNENDPKTHEGMNLTRVTTRELIAYASFPYASNPLFCLPYNHIK